LLDVQLKAAGPPLVQAGVAVNRQALQQVPKALGMSSVSSLNVSINAPAAAPQDPQAAPASASTELAKCSPPSACSNGASVPRHRGFTEGGLGRSGVEAAERVVELDLQAGIAEAGLPRPRGLQRGGRQAATLAIRWIRCKRSRAGPREKGGYPLQAHTLGRVQPMRRSRLVSFVFASFNLVPKHADDKKNITWGNPTFCDNVGLHTDKV
jgi:hypothetical protein